jgi:GNAT superfamily N-acetyltransferase
LEISCADFHGETLTIRNLRRGDLRLMLRFRDRLSTKSRDLFCPYPWGQDSALKKALATAIDNTNKRIDASYLILAGGVPVGHFFLWKAGGNPASRAMGVEVPELGVAVADAHQGRGLGALSVAILKAVATREGADAIELTTALSNAGGWNTYLRAGFRHLGNIVNPLEVDVTAVDEGRSAPRRFREERQMVYIIHHPKEKAVLAYLASKRKLSERFSLPQE